MTSKEIMTENYVNFNFSGNEHIVKDYNHRVQLLNNETNENKLIKQHLTIECYKNEKILQSLLKTKTEFENLKSDLQMKLFKMKVKSEKEKILYKKKFNDFFKQRKYLEDQYSKLPFVSELKELCCENNKLMEEFERLNSLFELTKKKYIELQKNYFSNLKKKICEFCYVALMYKALNSQNF